MGDRRMFGWTAVRMSVTPWHFETRLALKTIKIQSHSEKANAHRFRHKKYIITQRGLVDDGRPAPRASPNYTVCWLPCSGLVWFGPGLQTALGPLYYFGHKFVFWPAPLVFFWFFGCRILNHSSSPSSSRLFGASGTNATFRLKLSNGLTILWLKHAIMQISWKSPARIFLHYSVMLNQIDRPIITTSRFKFTQDRLHLLQIMIHN